MTITFWGKWWLGSFLCLLQVTLRTTMGREAPRLLLTSISSQSSALSRFLIFFISGNLYLYKWTMNIDMRFLIIWMKWIILYNNKKLIICWQVPLIIGWQGRNYLKFLAHYFKYSRQWWDKSESTIFSILYLKF